MIKAISQKSISNNYQIVLIAPASSLKPYILEKYHLELEEKIYQASKILSDYGISVEIPNNLFSTNYHPFYANTLDLRISQLIEAFSKYQIIDDPHQELEHNIDKKFKIRKKVLFWCFRGGYGSAEVAYKLIGLMTESLLNFNKNPNFTLLGYSDITALHGFCNHILNIPTIHCLNFNEIAQKQKQQIDKNNYHADQENSDMFTENRNLLSVINILSGHNIKMPLAPLKHVPKNVRLESTLIGGNLTVLTSLLAGKLDFPFRGKILFLEDTNEPPYSVKRALMALFMAGKMLDLTALIFGDFTLNTQNPQAYTDLCSAIDEFLADWIKIPSFQLKGVGHGEINNSLILGTKCIIDTEHLELTIDNPFTDLKDIF